MHILYHSWGCFVRSFGGWADSSRSSCHEVWRATVKYNDEILPSWIFYFAERTRVPQWDESTKEITNFRNGRRTQNTSKTNNLCANLVSFFLSFLVIYNNSPQ